MRRALGLVVNVLVTLVLLVLPACSSDDAGDSGPGDADRSTVDDGGGDTEDTAAGTGDGGELTAAQLCDAVDADAVAEAIAPVSETTVVDETVCNIGLDVPGLGANLSLSIEGNPLEVEDGDEFYEDVILGYETIYETEGEPVDDLGDGATAFAIDAGDAVVVRIGDEVVLFSPLLSDEEMTVDQWRPVIESILAGLG